MSPAGKRKANNAMLDRLQKWQSKVHLTKRGKKVTSHNKTKCDTKGNNDEIQESKILRTKRGKCKEVKTTRLSMKKKN